MAQLRNREAGFQRVTTFKPPIAKRVLKNPFISSVSTDYPLG
jgi:hypothetical protein